MWPEESGSFCGESQGGKGKLMPCGQGQSLGLSNLKRTGGMCGYCVKAQSEFSWENPVENFVHGVLFWRLCLPVWEPEQMNVIVTLFI